MTIGRTLDSDPIEEARRQWVAHGWAEAADGMAAVTSIVRAQQIVLQRTLHDWRASFNFTKNANGNYALVFSIFLMRLTDIKFDYQQQTIQP